MQHLVTQATCSSNVIVRAPFFSWSGPPELVRWLKLVKSVRRGKFLNSMSMASSFGSFWWSLVFFLPRSFGDRRYDHVCLVRSWSICSVYFAAALREVLYTQYQNNFLQSVRTASRIAGLQRSDLAFHDIGCGLWDRRRKVLATVVDAAILFDVRQPL
jgi:hypothetical protein